jgi:ketosteroid isomerase-like protein
MDHPHIALARALWTAVADGDAAMIRLLVAEDVEWRSAGSHPRAGTYRGPRGVLEYLAGIGEAVDRLQSTLEAMYVGEDGATLWYQVDARRGRRKLSMQCVLRLRMRDNRVTEALIVPVDQHTNDAFWR